jgi:predicted metal-dependent phosphoesterase TrpH
MSTPSWTVELHAHTIYSKDCLTRPESIQKICQKKGVDKIAVTDHDTARAALEMSKLFPMWVIPGEEIMTTKGELLAWYIREEIPSGLSPEDTIRILRDQGAVIGVSHPFDRYRKGAWALADLMSIVEHVDAIEVFNARCIHGEDNVKAFEFANLNRKLMTSGSDAHVQSEYGQAPMILKPFANNADGLRNALATATRVEKLSSPLVHFGSRWAKWMKKIRPSLVMR